MIQSSFEDKVSFLLLLARSLQACGAAAHHLERALDKAGRGLGLENQYLAFPTGLLASFQETEAQRSIVIRFQPGQIDLSKLSKIDEAADRVLAGSCSLRQGMSEMETINSQSGDYRTYLEVLAYALASGGFVTALKGSLADFFAALCLGLVIGSLSLLGRRSEALEQLFSALASALATCTAIFLARRFTTLSPDLVILASIVVLLPGLTLIIAFVELSTKNLIAGTARLAGASVDLMKLVFTIAITKKLLLNAGGSIAPSVQAPLPAWTEIPGVAALALGFVILFRVPPRHIWSAFTFAVLAYAMARFGSERLGIELSFFATGALVALSSNLIARIFQRPGLMTLLPGMILIVPGSINYRGFTSMFQNNVIDTVQTSFSVVIIAVSLVAGLFFGNTIVPPRRSL